MPTKVTAIDMYNGNLIVRPSNLSKAKYDFDFTKQGVWIYINSHNDIEAFQEQIDLIESKGESWRIIKAKTGTIVKTNVKS